MVTKSAWLLPEEKLANSEPHTHANITRIPKGGEARVLVDPARVQIGIQLAVDGLAKSADVERTAL